MTDVFEPTGVQDDRSSSTRRAISIGFSGLRVFGGDRGSIDYGADCASPTVYTGDQDSSDDGVLVDFDPNKSCPNDGLSP
jgi:hypothetical protein